VYFDGSGDYIDVGSAIVPTAYDTDYTIEMWIYPTTTGSREDIFNQYASNASGRMAININSDATISFFQNGLSPAETKSSAISANSWYHLAVVNSSGTRSFYVNGSLIGTATGTASVYSGNTEIGRLGDVASNYFTGYITDVRVVNGTAVYTSDFTPPTAPLTAVTNTSLLVSGTDASIIDKSQTSNLQVVGNTTGSTTQVKFADTKSIFVPSAGYVAGSASTANCITIDEVVLTNTESFTYEFWMKLSSTTQTASPYGHTNSNRQTQWNEGGVTGNIMLYMDGYIHQTVACYSAAEASNWMHVAYSFDQPAGGNNFKLFINGTQRVATSLGTWIYINTIGSGYLGHYHPINGYIQDFRVTKGLARYTTNFTPPTEPLKG